MKASIRGHYLSNAMDAALTTNAQFGKFYSAEKFINQLGKKPQLRKFLFQGDDATKLKNLQNTLAFAQGDLSRLPGLPGGIFIQLKKAGLFSNGGEMLKNPKKADLDKDGKLSSYEKRRGMAIEKNMKVKKANVGMAAKKVREKEMMKASMGKSVRGYGAARTSGMGLQDESLPPGKSLDYYKDLM